MLVSAPNYITAQHEEMVRDEDKLECVTLWLYSPSFILLLSLFPLEIFCPLCLSLMSKVDRFYRIK